MSNFKSYDDVSLDYCEGSISLTECEIIVPPNTGGPCIVPFSVPEKCGVMQNSTMQGQLEIAL